MVGLAEGVPKGGWVLEPGAHEAPFLRAFLEAHGKDYRFTALEVDEKAFSPPSFAERVVADFLLYEGGPFDAILANPPYGILGQSLHALKEKKAAYRKAIFTWRGRYNLYGAFLEKGVRLLKPGGVLVYVVPGSFLVLDEFKALRAFLAQEGETEVYYLGRAFRDRRVTAVVVRFWKGRARGVLRLFDRENGELKEVLEKPWRGEMVRFETEALLSWERSGVALGAVYEIRFATRSTEWARHPLTQKAPGRGLVPILTGRNLGPGRIDYETPYSGLYFPWKEAKAVRGFYGRPHLVVGHTKTAGKVVAAYDERAYPWREEFHLVLREGFSVLNVAPKGLRSSNAPFSEPALVEYLNSPEVEAKLKALYRDLAKHLTRAMLARIPLPVFP
ncbi:MAG: SAM-dependent methyltransferase [Thermus sp.]